MSDAKLIIIQFIVDRKTKKLLGYAPLFAPAMDNIIINANIAENKLNGFCQSFMPVEVKEKIENNDDFIFLMSDFLRSKNK